MSIKTFIHCIRSCSFLSKKLKGKLFVLSGMLEPTLRSEIALELKESTERQAAIVQDGIGELKRIEKSIRKEVRTGKEKRERSREQKNLPGFDDD